MYIEAVPDRASAPAILLRESYREGGKVKKRTLLNPSAWARERVEGLRALLNGGTVSPAGQEALSVTVPCRTVTSPPCSARCGRSASTVGSAPKASAAAISPSP